MSCVYKWDPHFNILHKPPSALLSLPRSTAGAMNSAYQSGWMSLSLNLTPSPTPKSDLSHIWISKGWDGIAAYLLLLAHWVTGWWGAPEASGGSHAPQEGSFEGGAIGTTEECLGSLPYLPQLSADQRIPWPATPAGHVLGWERHCCSAL